MTVSTESDHDEPVVKIEQLSLVHMATSKIRELLLAGTIKPGERVGEEWLTSRLGISRPPLREAIQVLVQQGLLVRQPRRGIRVVSLSESDIADIYSLRSVLDRFALKLGVPVKDPAGLEPLRHALVEMRASVESGEHPRYVEANRQYHLGLVALGGNTRLTSTYGILMNQMQLLMSINLWRESAADGEIGVRRHEDLLLAIESGDLDLALAALKAHGERRFLYNETDDPGSGPAS